MTYTLEQLSADIKAALKADPGKGGKEAVCKLVSKVCLDKEFIAQHLTPENCKPRRVLYQDPELGWDKAYPGPELPPEVVDGTRASYIDAFERITGVGFDRYVEDPAVLLR